MSSYSRGSRTIVCNGCKRRRRIKDSTRDICSRCERSVSEGKLQTDCNAAQVPPEQPSLVNNTCGRSLYIQHRSYREDVCSLCSKTGPIYEETATLCKTCHQTKLNRQSKDLLKVKVECVVCKTVRRSVCLNENICLPDYLARMNGYGTCIACGKEKVIWVKKDGARCRYCYKKYCAARSLRKFGDEYRGPNREYLTALLGTIDWNAVEEKTNRRLRVFGKFLQTVSLPDPLTWEFIEDAMPALRAANRSNPRFIRSCLLDLAHLRVEQGLLEKKEVYVARRIVKHLITLAPECFQELLRTYVAWLEKRKNSPSTVRYTLVSVNPFLSWCIARGITSSSEVDSHIFEEYEQFLTWKWVCERCDKALPFDVYAETPSCNSCDAVDSARKTRRYSHATVQKDCSMLRIFFRWAEISGFGPNPVGVAVRNEFAFRHYSDDVIKRLVEYVFSPHAQPIEALVLYLIIFHAFSVWELTHALLPHADINVSERRGLSDGYYVVLQAREVTRHNITPGRPEARVEFPASVATLLKPLLQRYERWRLETLDNLNNEYLLVAPGRARHDNPVCREFVRRVVKRGSIGAGVGECNPKRLRATTATSFADSGVIGVLTKLGWSASQGFRLTWSENREVVYPRNRLEAPRQQSS